MAHKPIKREPVLAAVLDVVVGVALFSATIYVAYVCLAVAG
jgi:hypothetical protein